MSLYKLCICLFLSLFVIFVNIASADLPTPFDLVPVVPHYLELNAETGANIGFTPLNIDFFANISSNCHLPEFLTWDFGDNTAKKTVPLKNYDRFNPYPSIESSITTIVTTNHTYKIAGTYTVSVTVTDDGYYEIFGEYPQSFPITVYPGNLENYKKPVADTGQTKCYDDEKIIPCPGPEDQHYGQDGNYSVNRRSYAKLDVNGKKLVKSANSWVMVKDNVTGLIWEVKTDDGSVHDKNMQYNWQDAQELFVNKLNSNNFGGYSDWRIPTVKELASITAIPVAMSST